jgi:hypothetical protein
MCCARVTFAAVGNQQTCRGNPIGTLFARKEERRVCLYLCALFVREEEVPTREQEVEVEARQGRDIVGAFDGGEKTCIGPWAMACGYGGHAK